jgi:RsiW-degrading membrane proteinase PrsW (M82 family)
MVRLLLFLAAVIPALLVLGYGMIKARGDWTNEAVWTAFLVGAVGTLAAIFIELGLGYVLDIGAWPAFARAAGEAIIVAAIPEESIKFFVLVAVAERHVDARRRQDIVILALSTALGFAAIENLLYLIEPEDWKLIATGRALTAVPGHGIDGLTMGALLTMARLKSENHRLWLFSALLLPIALHGAYDFALFIGSADKSLRVIAAISWLGILGISAIIALFLCNLALGKAATADRLSRRDIGPPNAPSILILSGLLLIAVSVVLSAFLFYSKDLRLPWMGAIIAVLPIALGCDLVCTGFYRAVRYQRNPADPEHPRRSI